MDTLSFLRYVLPPSGVKFLAVPRIHSESKRSYFKHFGLETFEEAAAYAAALAKRGEDVYFACSSFKAPTIEINGKTRQRVKENAGWVKAFWLDLDCGEGKEYASQQEALDDLTRFCEETGLPLPLLINSGNGVHCYWVLQEAITPEAWYPVAEMLRVVVDNHGVRQDGKCTTDVARVLRPVGTFNFKGEPKPVALFSEELPEPVTFEQFKGWLTELAGARVAQEAAALQLFAVTNDLAAGREFPPSSAVEIASRCQQVGAFAQSGGNVPEPLWYQMLGLLKHTTEGEDVCQQWSSGHPSYDPEHTQRKIEQWAFGPSTCESIERAHADGCKNCPWRGKIKSPIQLGVQLPESEPVVTPTHQQSAAETDAPLTETETPVAETETPLFEIPEAMQGDFSYSEGRLFYKGTDKKGLPAVHAFCEQAFWPEAYFRDDGAVQVNWVSLEPSGRFHKFSLGGGGIGAGGQTLFSALGEHGIVAVSGRKREMEAYINSWFTELKRKVEETVVFHHYGWQSDHSFVVGDRRYMPDGTVREAKIAGDAALPTYVDAFKPRGTLEQWVEMVDKAYNYVGQEQYQMVVGAGFGAPLMQLFENYGGITLHGFSPEKGLGKSTALKLQVGIYGDPKRLMRTKQQVTAKAYIAHCGILHSLPVAMDEATNIDPRELSDMVYTFSQGTPRTILYRTGHMNTNQQGWSSIQTTTANRSLISTVGAFKSNADAEIGRIFEVQFYKVSSLSKEEADRILAESELCYGVAGDIYIRYLVQNREKVRALLEKVRIQLDRRVGFTVQDRFNSVGLACTVTGLLIANELGLTRFDIKQFINWLVKKAHLLREVAEQNTPPVLDVFGKMLTEISKGLLVTASEGDLRAGKAAAVIQSPNGDITGRLIQDTGALYLQQSTVRAWCSKNQADYGGMFKAVVDAGWAEPEPRTYALGKGMKDYALPPIRCWKLDYTKMSGEDAVTLATEKIYRIK